MLEEGFRILFKLALTHSSSSHKPKNEKPKTQNEN